MKIKATKISWSIDNIDLNETPMDLPYEVEIPERFVFTDSKKEISSYLEDTYKYRPKDFEIEKATEKNNIEPINLEEDIDITDNL